jgi:hypothetical protein
MQNTFLFQQARSIRLLYVCLLLYIVRLVIEIDTAEPLVPDPSPFEVEIAIAKWKRY